MKTYSFNGRLGLLGNKPPLVTLEQLQRILEGAAVRFADATLVAENPGLQALQEGRT